MIKQFLVLIIFLSVTVSNLITAEQSAIENEDDLKTILSHKLNKKPMNMQRVEKTICKLPQEIIMHILSFLPLKDVKAVQSISKHFQESSIDNPLWKALLIKDFPNTIKNMSEENYKEQYKNIFLSRLEIGEIQEGIEEKLFKDKKLDLSPLANRKTIDTFFPYLPHNPEASNIDNIKSKS